MTANDAHLMAEVQRISADIEARTGYKPYQYTSAPTPTSERIVFQHEVYRTPAEAYARVLEIRDQIASGEWDAWNCRAPDCAWRFDTETERDNHEHHESACRIKLTRQRQQQVKDDNPHTAAELRDAIRWLIDRMEHGTVYDADDQPGGDTPPRPRRAFYVDEAMRDKNGFIPALITENEPGYHAMRGNPDDFQQPWYWGQDIDTARRICAQANAKMGLSEDDALAIVASSFAASVGRQSD